MLLSLPDRLAGDLLVYLCLSVSICVYLCLSVSICVYLCLSVCLMLLGYENHMTCHESTTCLWQPRRSHGFSSGLLENRIWHTSKAYGAPKGLLNPWVLAMALPWSMVIEHPSRISKSIGKTIKKNIRSIWSWIFHFQVCSSRDTNCQLAPQDVSNPQASVEKNRWCCDARVDGGPFLLAEHRERIFKTWEDAIHQQVWIYLTKLSLELSCNGAQIHPKASLPHHKCWCLWLAFVYPKH